MREYLAAGAAILLLLSGTASSQEEPTQTPVPLAVLVVYIEGIEGTDGNIVVNLFNSSESFFIEPFRNSSTPLEGLVDFQVRFEEIPPGEYVVSVLHDLNGNGELERGLVGRAHEPIAFSNEARFGFGPPSFADAVFAIGAGLNEIIIRF